MKGLISPPAKTMQEQPSMTAFSLSIQFIVIPNLKGRQRKECSNQHIVGLISHAGKVMLETLQAGFRKGRGTRDQIANIFWIMEKAREFQKNIYFCFIDYAKAFHCVDHNKLENSERDGNTRPPDLPLQKPIFRSGSNS